MAIITVGVLDRDSKAGTITAEDRLHVHTVCVCVILTLKE